MHQLRVPAVDELLEKVWPNHQEEGTVLSGKPLTDILRHLKKHITMSGRQRYYAVQARARGKRPLQSCGGELSCQSADVAVLRKVAEQSASLMCVLQHFMCHWFACCYSATLLCAAEHAQVWALFRPLGC